MLLVVAGLLVMVAPPVSAQPLTWTTAQRGSCVVSDFDELDGVFYSSITADGATECYAVSSAVRGDLDIRVQTTTPVDGSSRATSLCLYNEANVGCNTILPVSATVDGLWYRNLVDSILSAFTVTDGMATQLGSSSTATTDPHWFRVTRTADIVSFYRRDIGGTWTLDETTTFVTDDSLFIYLSYVNNGLTDGTSEIMIPIMTLEILPIQLDANFVYVLLAMVIFTVVVGFWKAPLMLLAATFLSFLLAFGVWNVFGDMYLTIGVIFMSLAIFFVTFIKLKVFA